ncbi:MAG: preprotein translocase subunit Sec61beta [Candidatus Hydrothermarchaeota archaeon]
MVRARGKRERTQLPSSAAGLVRYMDVEESKIHISPEAVIGLTLVLVGAEIAIHLFGI